MNKLSYPKSNSIYAALDIGSSKIACAVGKNDSSGVMHLLGISFKTTKSVKKGYILDINKIGNEINDVIEDVSKKTQTKISNLIVNANIVDSKSNFLKGEIEIGDEQIDDFHIKSSINNSELYKADTDYESIHNVITNFEIDNEKKLVDPRGFYANKLAVKIYQILIKKNYTKSLKNILTNLNLSIENIVASPYASSLSSLIDDEKELGTICLDLGSGTTSVCIVENKNLIFADAISVGSNNITYDLASGLTTSIESAERLKTLYGSVFSNPSDEHELIDVSIIGSENNKFNQINRSLVNSFIKPRVEETLELIRQKLKEYNLHNKKYRRVVLTGGGSLLEGIDEYAKIIFDSQVRIGFPTNLLGINKEIAKPQFGVVLGLLVNTLDESSLTDLLTKNDEKIRKNSVFEGISSWLNRYI